MECGDCEMYKLHKHLSVCAPSHHGRSPPPRENKIGGYKAPPDTSSRPCGCAFLNYNYLASQVLFVVHRCKENHKAPVSRAMLITVLNLQNECLLSKAGSSFMCYLRTRKSSFDYTVGSYLDQATATQALQNILVPKVLTLSC